MKVVMLAQYLLYPTSIPSLSEILDYFKEAATRDHFSNVFIEGKKLFVGEDFRECEKNRIETCYGTHNTNLEVHGEGCLEHSPRSQQWRQTRLELRLQHWHLLWARVHTQLSTPNSTPC